MFTELLAFFEANGWPINQLKGEPILSFTYAGVNGQWVFAAAMHEDIEVLTFWSRAPDPCPAERRAAMAQLFARANFGMTHGGFDLDLDDGEMRYRTGMDLAGVGFQSDNAISVARYNVATMDYYLPAIRAVIDGQSAEKALAAL